MSPRRADFSLVTGQVVREGETTEAKRRPQDASVWCPESSYPQALIMRGSKYGRPLGEVG